MSNIATIDEAIYGTRDSFASVLADRSINFEREAEFAIQSLYGNQYATKIATANKQSVIDAVVNIAAIGISLNPAKRQAYLVPRDGKICLDISYIGLMDLAIDSGSIMWGQAELVYERDTFVLNGVDREPTHQRNPFARDRGEIVGAYCVVKTHSGDYLTTCMSREEIDDIMNRSQSVKSGKSSPWKTDWGEMAKKTVVKRGYKYWPKSDRLSAAVQHLNTEAGEGLPPINTAYVSGQSHAATLAIQQTIPTGPERDAADNEAREVAKDGVQAFREMWAAWPKQRRALVADLLPDYQAIAEKVGAEDAEVQP